MTVCTCTRACTQHVLLVSWLEAKIRSILGSIKYFQASSYKIFVTRSLTILTCTGVQILVQCVCVCVSVCFAEETQGWFKFAGAPQILLTGKEPFQVR